MRAKILLFAIIALTMASCDDNGDGGFTPESPFRDLSSPENVLHNLTACYNEMSYDHLAPMICDDFQFFIWSGDADGIPGELAPEGYFSRAAFLTMMQNMLTEGFLPCGYPDLQVGDMEAALSKSGELSTAPPEGAPPGTRMWYVNLDLQVNTVGTIIFVVRSRPLFYFSPDSTQVDTKGVTWQIWRVDDGQNLNNPGSLWSDAGAEASRSGPALGAASRGNPAGPSEVAGPGAPAVDTNSWGRVLSLFYTPCGWWVPSQSRAGVFQ